MIKICENCKKEFKTHSSKSKCCSRKCSSELKKVEYKFTCIQCGVEFIKRKSNEVKFCCKECYKKHKLDPKNKNLYIQKPREIVKCQTCNKEFKSRGDASKFCCINCYNESLPKKKEVICENCQKTFIVNNGKRNRFCSMKCSGEFVSKNYIPDINLIKKECLNCKKEYEVHNYRVETTKFCSTFCYDNFRRDFKICPTCKKEFSAPKYENRKYCSEQCASRGVDKRKSKLSISVLNFLKKYKFNIVEELFIREGNKKIFADFTIDDKLIIECYGDYWHCNPVFFNRDYFHKKILKTAEDIWQFDEKRVSLLKQKGYKVIIIWEDDWNRNCNDEKYLEELLKQIKNEIQ